MAADRWLQIESSILTMRSRILIFCPVSLLEQLLPSAVTSKWKVYSNTVDCVQFFHPWNACPLIESKLLFFCGFWRTKWACYYKSAFDCFCCAVFLKEFMFVVEQKMKKGLIMPPHPFPLFPTLHSHLVEYGIGSVYNTLSTISSRVRQ